MTVGFPAIGVVGLTSTKSPLTGGSPICSFSTPHVAARVIFSMISPFHRLQIDDLEHHQSWRAVAVARRWEVPSHPFKRTCLRRAA